MSPVILHREDMINARKAFKNFRDAAVRQKFDDALLGVIATADFKVVAVVIDKQELRRAHDTAAAHPYHLGLGFLLQRFARYLNHINRVGDILGEARGGREDRLLKESYSMMEGWRDTEWCCFRRLKNKKASFEAFLRLPLRAIHLR